MDLKQKFEFGYYENASETGSRIIKIAFDGDKTVDQFLEEVMSFMKAVGYVFDDINDRLEVVNDFKSFESEDTLDSEEDDEDDPLSKDWANEFNAYR
jgi:hypothetical protein